MTGVTTAGTTAKVINSDNKQVNVSIADVLEFFSRSGEIVDLKLQISGTQSNAHGSVRYSQKGSAQQAIKSLDGVALGSRFVNVDSLDLVGGAVVDNAASSTDNPKPHVNKSVSAGPTGEYVRGRGRGRGRGGYAPRGRGGMKRGGGFSHGERVDSRSTGAEQSTEEKTAVEPVPAPEAEAPAESAPAVPQSESVTENKDVSEETTVPETTPDTPAPRPEPRKQRERRAPEGVPNDTLVFMSGLAPNVDNAAIMSFLAAYEPKSAHVVRMRYFPHRSKGFAFVDFHSHEMQQKAITEMFGKVLNGRNVSLKVAIQPENGNDANVGEAASPAPEQNLEGSTA
ncbi:hypothetical protein MCUN1_002061 [Malassezia cuniculi]|uniref:RRM domain-containing protein n=1 Tax=Malassezia cuniculi TaxID=948313 RepID=A0AAF0ERD7_9BASI|nr:hypothetical protein MCUN1_002061 [Malassezia cuniculi]